MYFVKQSEVKVFFLGENDDHKHYFPLKLGNSDGMKTSHIRFFAVYFLQPLAGKANKKGT